MISIRCLPRITEEHIQQIQAAAGQHAPKVKVVIDRHDWTKIPQVTGMLKSSGYRVRVNGKNSHTILMAEPES